MCVCVCVCVCVCLKEHEGHVEQLKKELATSEEQYNTQLQVQVVFHSV